MNTLAIRHRLRRPIGTVMLAREDAARARELAQITVLVNSTNAGRARETWRRLLAGVVQHLVKLEHIEHFSATSVSQMVRIRKPRRVLGWALHLG